VVVCKLTFSLTIPVLIAVFGSPAQPALASTVADAVMRGAAAAVRDSMRRQGLPTPTEGRTLDSICVTNLCR
jgi:hypothetical protein